MADPNQDRGTPAMAGTLKLLAIVAILVVGILAVLLVADVIPRDVFREALTKGLSILGIVAAVSGAIALIARK
jgi:hypothetical protein